ncbi:hypothetical protein ACFPYJ_14535 [Paenibacillus solisilvae]|uniref:Uncharacterized protein n=1 Tax=Paenibacillus solisilvae TaxID=2486751 RepID=A0ABW0VWS4_9BACL
MKIIVAYISILLLSLSFLVIADVLAGMPLSTAIHVQIESFNVSSLSENVAIVLLMIIPILTPFMKKLCNPK